MDYILSCCSTVDITNDHLNKIDVKYTNFHYELDGVEFTDDLVNGIDYEDFYRKVASGVDTKTSQVNADEFVVHFEKYLKEGKDVLHICLSSGLSGVYNSANIAKNILMDKYIDRKIYIVDSLCASSGYGLFVDTLAKKKAEGMDIEELYNWAEDNKLRLNSLFFSTDLKFYIRGGRISKTAGLVGSVLNICPLLYVNNEGKLIPSEKIRGKKNVIHQTVNRMGELADGGFEYDGDCFISHSACLEDAMALSDEIMSKFPNIKNKPIINYVGTTIGSHTGPGTVALFFFGKKRGE